MTLLSHADSFYCPTEIKEIMLPSLCAALSAISALSAGHYYLMREVFYCPDFYCPAEIKEIAEIIVTDPAKFFLLFLWDIIISCA